MATMNISLPDDLKSFIDEQVAGRYSTSSEYVRELIRREQDRLKVRELILQGAASPLDGTADDALFEELRRIASSPRNATRRPREEGDR